MHESKRGRKACEKQEHLLRTLFAALDEDETDRGRTKASTLSETKEPPQRLSLFDVSEFRLPEVE